MYLIWMLYLYLLQKYYKTSKGYITLCPFQRWFAIHKPGLAMINLCAKFEVFVSTNYEDVK